jgi:hypothetical protein
MVEYSNHSPKIKGLNPANGIERKRERERERERENCEKQGILTEGECSVQVTSSLRYHVL